MMFNNKMAKTQNILRKEYLLLIPLVLGILTCITIITAAEPYYNTSYGPGFEGFLNYGNLMIDGWFVNAFMAFIWIVIFFGLSKSNYDGTISIAFASFICLFGTIIISLFTSVSSYLIFLFAIGLAGSIGWAIAKGRQ